MEKNKSNIPDARDITEAIEDVMKESGINSNMRKMLFMSIAYDPDSKASELAATIIDSVSEEAIKRAKKNNNPL